MLMVAFADSDSLLLQEERGAFIGSVDSGASEIRTPLLEKEKEQQHSSVSL